jgi:hypothetical protein
MHIRLSPVAEIEANRHCLARKTAGSFHLASEQWRAANKPGNVGRTIEHSVPELEV